MLVKAGPVQALYDKGFLRYIQTAGHEAVRMIYFAVRDQDWQTMPGTLTDEHIQTTTDTFSISYTYHINQENIKMQWQAIIAGQADGTITFDIHGVAQNSFLKNRAGFCVLHPIAGVSGQPCRLDHPDGSFSYGTFPNYISPHQPFLQVKAMEWPIAEQGIGRLEFSGDVFETEDQRNWSDASYKTYCTPLSQPFPAQVKTGDQIKQQVVFWLPKPLLIAAEQIVSDLRIQLQSPPIPFPAIGIGINSDGTELTSEESTFVQSVGFQHIRVDIFLNQATWPETINKVIQQTAPLQLPVELALFFNEDAELQTNQLVRVMQQHPIQLKSILIFDVTQRFTTSNLLQKVVPILRTAFPGISLGGGSDTNFTEFNRNPFPLNFVDFITYPVNPQVHATDDLTLVENTTAQADTVKSARHLAQNKPIHVSPVTLKPRFNEVATSNQTQSSIPADPRQPSNFIAGWTLASLKYLAEVGASSITYFETSGPRGIYQNNQPYAVGYLLAYVLRFKPERIMPTTFPAPLQISSLLLLKNTGACLLITNHTPESQLVWLPESFTVHTHTLIGTTMGQATYPNYLPGSQVTLTAFQTIALEGVIATKSVII